MKRSSRWSPSDLASARSRLGGPLSGSQSTSEIGTIKPPRTKYGNRSAVDGEGRRFDSKLELRYAQQLDLQWLAGAIAWYTRQVPFLLEGGVSYRADFLVVRYEGGTAPAQFWPVIPLPIQVEVIDCKGAMTQASRNKMKQVQARYGIVVQIYRHTGTLVPYTEVPVTRKPPVG